MKNIVIGLLLSFLAANGAQAQDSAPPDFELAPIPTDPNALSLEIDLLEQQRDAIDIAGITALQWIGASVMIASGVVAAFTLLIGGLAAIGDNAGEYFGGAGAIGLGSAAGGLLIGGLMVGLAELDGNLQQRRAYSRRIHVLRRAQREFAPTFSISPRGGMVGLQGSF